MRYVKGYQIDWQKVKAFLDITEDSDPRIDAAMVQIMDFVDRSHWICMARPIGAPPPTCGFTVISFGKEAWGEDLEELRKKDIPTPKYLEKLAEHLFSGPDVYEFEDW